MVVARNKHTMKPNCYRLTNIVLFTVVWVTE